MNDYERIARVIQYLDRHHGIQPSLGELAARAGLSESHFHRLFHRWAGVTPKSFLQSLTVESAKRRLRESASVLDTALEAGLSGPGRLHDLLVSLEAASPGEFKNRGEGVRVHWGWAESPFGCCCIGWNARGICFLSFEDATSGKKKPHALFEEWHAAKFVRDDREAQRYADAVFSRKPVRKAQLRAFVQGTSFQVKVWRALLRIPAGCVTTYKRIAQAMGEPNAVRAVGNACGCNPIAFLIPCHRVIRETGIVQGYRWDAARKRAILAWESPDASSLGERFAPNRRAILPSAMGRREVVPKGIQSHAKVMLKGNG